MDLCQAVLVTDGNLVGVESLVLDPSQGAADQLVELLLNLDGIAPDVGATAAIVSRPFPHAIVHSLVQVLAERHIDRFSLTLDGPQPRLGNAILLVFVELVAACYACGNEPFPVLGGNPRKFADAMPFLVEPIEVTVASRRGK